MIDVFWRLSHKAYHKGYVRIPRVLEIISMVIYSHAVSAKIVIGENSRVYHHGLGCVVLDTTVIGNNTKILQNVTIGNSFSDSSKKGGQ